ncbi:hypothetical protein JCM13304A_07400 [Desulfothermus okinawensis JCM 13304]
MVSKCNVSLFEYNITDHVSYFEIGYNKYCKDINIKLTIHSKNYEFYFNNSMKIKHAAVPYGFSVKTKDGFKSLGVEKNIKKIEVSGLWLSNKTKIYEKDNLIILKWVFEGNLKIDRVNILNQIILTKNDVKDCDYVYQEILFEPVYCDKEIKKFKIMDYKEFLDECINQYKFIYKNFKIKKIFDLKKIKNKNLSKYLKTKNQDKLNNTNASCHVHLILFDRINHKKLDGNDFSYNIEKLNKEKFEKIEKRKNFVLPQGLYVIKAISANYHGTSKPLNCMGRHVYLVIGVIPNIYFFE